VDEITYFIAFTRCFKITLYL